MFLDSGISLCDEHLLTEDAARMILKSNKPIPKLTNDN